MFRVFSCILSSVRPRPACLRGLVLVFGLRCFIVWFVFLFPSSFCPSSVWTGNPTCSWPPALLFQAIEGVGRGEGSPDGSGRRPHLSWSWILVLKVRGSSRRLGFTCWKLPSSCGAAGVEMEVVVAVVGGGISVGVKGLCAPSPRPPGPHHLPQPTLAPAPSSSRGRRNNQPGV